MKISNFAEIEAAALQATSFDTCYPRKQKTLIFSRKIRGLCLLEMVGRGDLNPCRGFCIAPL
ncbi:hypothetical protein [Stutzerimonas nitrititolerans]|uniref:hypothetical protein n=1 Tax=Stutzerimonas nitrititolerans TaxID=2482751 RepID=UPI0028ABFD00|nr:hypothetical protein [Stutzerimonas nitrititolerans]